MCDAFVYSLEKIIGPVEGLEPVSNEKFSLKDLTAHLKGIMEKYSGSDGIIFLVEFKGGSGFMAAKKAAMEFVREHQGSAIADNIGIVTGVNMPMLVTFATARDSAGVEDLMNSIKAEGINGVTIEKLKTGNEEI